MSMPVHSKIMDYWKDKCITDDFNIAIEGEYDYLKSIPVINDWGEPECWCCGKFIKDIYKYKDYDKLLKEDYKKIWDYGKVKSKLNRCHIIPKALGGSDEPNNLFLMCEECHRESPDYSNPIFFFEFVYNKRKSMKYESHSLKFILRVYDLAIKLNKDISTLNIDALNKSKMNTHGGKVSESTIIAAIVDSIDNIGIELESKQYEIYKNIIETFKTA